MIIFTQTTLADDAGHMLEAEATIEAGHVELSAIFQNVYIDGDEPGSREFVGQVCTERRVVLDGERVLDPGRARELWAMAVNQH